jgi:hypothetical protein
MQVTGTENKFKSAFRVVKYEFAMGAMGDVHRLVIAPFPG